MNMNLEDHLRRLTDPVAAPPTEGARQAISHRKGVLRRRRQARNAALGGTFMVLAIAGAMFLQQAPNQPDNVADSGHTVALTVDGEGWDVFKAEELSQPNELAEAQPDSYQVFRRPGDLAGPTVFVTSWAVTDTNMYPEDEYMDVTINPDMEIIGHLKVIGPESLQLEWYPLDMSGDLLVEIDAWGLSQEEVVDFAADLTAKDDDLVGGAPGSPDDVFGVVAGSSPQGITEQQVVRANPEPTTHYRVVGTTTAGDANGDVDIQVSDTGQYGFETSLQGLLIGDKVTLDEVTVAKRPALLYHGENDPEDWSLVVALTDELNAHIIISAVAERAVVDDTIEHMKLVKEGEWEELLARYGVQSAAP